MKKKIALIAAIVCLLTVTACGAKEETAALEGEQTALTAAEEQTLTVEEVMEASASDAAAKSQPPASDTDAVLNEDAYAAAQECIGRTVDQLYAAVGEPTDGSQYAASCAQDDAEDGMLFYDGFYVWTLRTADEEIVQAVYLMD